MVFNNNSLCNTCVHKIDCSLTSNKNAIWSCSEYEKRDLLETNTISDFSF